MAWLLAGVAILGGSLTLSVALDPTRSRPATVALSVLVVLLGAIAGVLALLAANVGGIRADPTVQLALLGGYAFASLCWIAFATEYTGTAPTTTRRWVGALALLGVLAVGSSAITWLHDAGRRDFGVLGTVSYLSSSVLQIAVFALGLLGVVLLARSTLRYDDLPAWRGATLSLGGLGVALLPFTIPLGQQLSTTATLAIGLGQVGVTVGVLGLGELRGELLAPAPAAGHLARETVLAALDHPVVVTDHRQRVLDANRSATRTFDLPRSNLRRGTLSELTGLDVDDPDRTIATPVTLRTTGGRRQFEVRRTDIDGDEGRPAGAVYLFQDVTDRRTREQQLQVLNRVLRHTLRNDLDAIRGFAEPVREGALDRDVAVEQLDRIEGLATDLVDLAETVEHSGRLLTAEQLDPADCDLEAIAGSVLEAVDADVSLTRSQSAPVVHSDPEIVRLVVAELVENAVEHSDRDSPTVSVAVTGTADGATLTVRDDGPGIPEYEQRILLGGEETPAAHGSGVGLWLVHWAVTRLGGRLEFGDNDPRGTVVTVSLPDLSDAPDASGEYV
ncbi:histidine kinase [Salinarchaeum sp. Harcht-Bsk1]|uniref:sensor histidine kinase n=1 Tax=Salinarchaeum sp. Harcht-Bsk1 TaxID=1333523 RepID=UPI00034235E7|nr:PAS domain-containing sensor histidine kinase [Salinarchaeum sp. Harcht-Bsk1]AGN00854.1 histidine kinase [Salinarchaeum sp. Harcht-Bsk1]